MSVTRVDAVVDALVAVLAADPALDGVGVYDGPPVTDLVFDAFVVVGGSELLDGEWADFATVSQDWHDLGPSALRDEAVVVPCVAHVYDGGDDLPSARARAVSVVGAVESALRANRSLGVAEVLPETQVDAARWMVSRDATGVRVRCEFTVTVRSLI